MHFTSEKLFLTFLLLINKPSSSCPVINLKEKKTPQIVKKNSSVDQERKVAEGTKNCFESRHKKIFFLKVLLCCPG